MNEQTETVMARYRELGSNLEASRVALWEFCGPTITYARGLESLKPPKMSPGSVPTEDVPIDNMSGLPDLCPQCSERPNERGRSMCSACRKRAYRERSK